MAHRFTVLDETRFTDPAGPHKDVARVLVHVMAEDGLIHTLVFDAAVYTTAAKQGLIERSLYPPTPAR